MKYRTKYQRGDIICIRNQYCVVLEQLGVWKHTKDYFEYYKVLLDNTKQCLGYMKNIDNLFIIENWKRENILINKDPEFQKLN